jgi:hypothetical protein
MKIYIAGPMTGLEDLNFPLFHEAAATLRALNHVAVNPAEIVPDPLAKWEDCMRAVLRELLACEAVAVLPGWTTSKGARLEIEIATKLGMLVRPWTDIAWATADPGPRRGYPIGQAALDAAKAFALGMAPPVSACTGNCQQGRACTCKYPMVSL